MIPYTENSVYGDGSAQPEGEPQYESCEIFDADAAEYFWDNIDRELWNKLTEYFVKY